MPTEPPPGSRSRTFLAPEVLSPQATLSLVPPPHHPQVSLPQIHWKEFLCKDNHCSPDCNSQRSGTAHVEDSIEDWVNRSRCLHREYYAVKKNSLSLCIDMELF